MHLRRARTRELPGNIPFSVKKHYIDRFLATWMAPTVALFNKALAIYGEEVDTVVRKHFEAYEHGGLLDLILYVIFCFALSLVPFNDTRKGRSLRCISRGSLRKPWTAFNWRSSARPISHTPRILTTWTRTSQSILRTTDMRALSTCQRLPRHPHALCLPLIRL